MNGFQPKTDARILLVEDDDVDYLVARRLFSQMVDVHYELDRAPDYETALEAIRRRDHDLLIVDFYLGGYTGLDLLREMAAAGSYAPVIVLTAAGNRDVDLAVMQAGAADYLVKGEIIPPLLERSIRYSLERHRLVEELRALSLRDDLTGLYNRRAFMTLADQQLKLAVRRSRPLSVLFADVDGLKQINDTFGHREGDLAIAAAADVLKRTFRTSDLVARLGGDEFIVLTPDSSEQSLRAMIDRLWEHLDVHNASERLRYRLSLSIGVSTFEPGRDGSIGSLIAAADRELYAAKHRRRTKSSTTLRAMPHVPLRGFGVGIGRRGPPR